MSVSSRRYLSLWLRRLPTDRIERLSPEHADKPFVVAATIQSAQRITALNDAAARLQLKLDMAVADARAMYPWLPVVEADPYADARLLEAIADWCDRYTPLVGLDAPDGLLLDVTGCAHLFGGEAALCRDLLTRLHRQGLRARVAIADAVGCAWAVARYSHSPALVDAPSPLEGEGSATGQTERMGEGSRSHEGPLPLTPQHSLQLRRSPLPQGERAREARSEFVASLQGKEIVIVPRGATERAALPLPIAALRTEPGIVSALASLGLKTVTDLAARPRAPLAARFGKTLIERLDQALGRADEPITPRLPLPLAMAERRFPEPIARETDVLGTIEHLAHELARVLERRGEGARLFGLALFRTDGKVHRLELGTGAPVRDPPRVRKLFEERLAALGDACDPGFGYDMVRLSALVTERSDPQQTGLVDESKAAQAEELSHLVDRFGARFGLRRVTRLVPRDTHIPEYAVAAVPAHAARKIAAVQPVEQDTLLTARPIRLFERPQPIAVTAEVPDGPPARFQWRNVSHHVVRVEGPERIAMEWWRDDRGNKLTRDYFRVESRSGARVWLYREGLYGETAQPRWYLHGLFA